jgi:hypothetical protein
MQTKDAQARRAAREARLAEARELIGARPGAEIDAEGAPPLDPLLPDHLPPLTRGVLVGMGVAFGVGAAVLLLFDPEIEFYALFLTCALGALMYVLRKTVPPLAHLVALVLLVGPPAWYIVSGRWRIYTVLLAPLFTLGWLMLCVAPVAAIYWPSPRPKTSRSD